jgi:hypothetical protein
LKERIQHTNRIRGLLFGQGINNLRSSPQGPSLTPDATSNRRWSSLAGSFEGGDLARNRSARTHAGPT